MKNPILDVKNLTKTYGKKTLNDADKRKLLLDVTKENRSYDLKSMLSEEEWNY